MLTARIGVPSGFQEAAQSNREIDLVTENQLLRNEVIRLKNKLLVRQAEMINSEGRDYIPTTLLKAV